MPIFRVIFGRISVPHAYRARRITERFRNQTGVYLRVRILELIVVREHSPFVKLLVTRFIGMITTSIKIKISMLEIQHDTPITMKVTKFYSSKCRHTQTRQMLSNIAF